MVKKENNAGLNERVAEKKSSGAEELFSARPKVSANPVTVISGRDAGAIRAFLPSGGTIAPGCFSGLATEGQISGIE
jgi:hypothetical protein